MKVDYECVERMGQTHEDLTNKAEDHAMPRDVASAAAVTYIPMIQVGS